MAVLAYRPRFPPTPVLSFPETFATTLAAAEGFFISAPGSSSSASITSSLLIPCVPHAPPLATCARTPCAPSPNPPSSSQLPAHASISSREFLESRRWAGSLPASDGPSSCISLPEEAARRFASAAARASVSRAAILSSWETSEVEEARRTIVPASQLRTCNPLRVNRHTLDTWREEKEEEEEEVLVVKRREEAAMHTLSTRRRAPATIIRADHRE